MRHGTAFALGLIALLASPGNASAQDQGEFRDWFVSCGADRACNARTDASGDVSDDALASIAFQREGEADSPLQLVLPIRPTGPVILTIDGDEELRLASADFAETPEGAFASADGAVREEILPVLRAGSQVSLAVPTEEGPQTAEFSLAGLTASLLFMDEKQGRDGTRTALIAIGEAGLRDLPELSREIQTSQDLPEAVRRRWEESPADCAEFFGMEPPSLGFSVPIRDARLYMLMCGGPGAYNAYYEFFLDVDDTVYPILVPNIIEDGPIVEYGAWNVSYEEETGEITSFFKGRGIGDCGSWQRFGWTEGAAQASGLVLLEARVKGECDGDDGGGLENWPKVWPRD